MCGAEGTVSTGEAEAEVETGADRGSFGGQSGCWWEAEGPVSRGEAGGGVERGGVGGGLGGGLGGGGGAVGPAGNWVLTELLPHGPAPTGHVPHHRGVAATIAASPL